MLRRPMAGQHSRRQHRLIDQDSIVPAYAQTQKPLRRSRRWYGLILRIEAFCATVITCRKSPYWYENICKPAAPALPRLSATVDY